MNTEHLRYFLTVVQCGSIGKAADRLQLRQQYLSSVIKSLEQQFGTQLFIRHTRGVTLTEDGTYLHGKIQQIMQLLNEAQLDYLYPSKSVYRDTVNDIYFHVVPMLAGESMGNVLTQYRQHFPNVSIHIVEQDPRTLIETVNENREAIGLVQLQDRTTEQLQQVVPQGLKVIPYRTIEIVAIVARQEAETWDKPSISLEELRQKNLIVYAPYGVEDTAMYQILKDQGTLEFQYVVENSALFFSLLRKSKCYSVGLKDGFQNDGIQEIPFTKPIVAFMVHEEFLDYFSVKSLINTLRAYQEQPML